MRRFLREPLRVAALSAVLADAQYTMTVLIDTRLFLPASVAPAFLLKNGFPADTLTPFAPDNFTRLKQLGMIRAVYSNLAGAHPSRCFGFVTPD